MQNNKTKFRNYFNVFIPSSLSIVFCVFFAGTAIVLNQFDYIKQYLELPRSLQLSRIVAGWADKFLTTTIGETHTETLVVGMFWAFVGLAVYMFLRGLSRFAMELDDNITVRHYVWPKGTDRTRPLRMLIRQAAFRLCAIVALLIVLFGLLAPVVRGPVFADFLGPNKLLQYAVWFAASVLVWHIITILLRLIALRARLFG